MQKATGSRGNKPIPGWMPSVRIAIGSVLLAVLAGGWLIQATGASPIAAYGALLKGAFGTLPAFARTLEKATPLVLNGLAIAFAFRTGLFNIGTHGQFLFGALAAAVAGFSVPAASPWILLPLSLMAGMAAGAVYGMIQGALKAYSGAHEVITGIMCNYIAINLTDYCVTQPFRDTAPGNVIARTPEIFEAGRIPALFGMPGGFFFSILVAFLVWWVLAHSVIGFEMATVGAGPDAARYSGMRIRRTVVITMLISGALAGLGGAVETLGVVHRFQPGVHAGIGFEGITAALLGRVHPFGIFPAALLLGAMKAGAGMMQFSAGVNSEIIDVIQALILFFVSADVILRRILPGAKRQAGRSLSLHSGWKGHS